MIFTCLDKDARNFIDATGLNNDANLNVNGAYNAETARYAINFLTTGIKSIGIWNLITVCYPFVGGTANAHKFNLINPLAYQLTFQTGALGIPVHNEKGWKLGRALTGLLHDTEFNSGLSLGASLSEPNTVNDCVEISSGVEGNNTGIFFSVRSDGFIAIRTQQGTQQGFWKGTPKGVFLTSKISTSTNVFQNGEDVVFSSSNSNPPLILGSNEFILGQASPTSSHSTATRSSIIIGQPMSLIQGKQLTKLMKDFNSILKRQ